VERGLERGRATLTTEPSMKAKAEPRMMAIRIHFAIGLRAGCCTGAGADLGTWRDDV